MKTKRMICILLAVLCAFSVTACGTAETTTEEKNTITNEAKEAQITYIDATGEETALYMSDCLNGKVTAAEKDYNGYKQYMLSDIFTAAGIEVAEDVCTLNMIATDNYKVEYQAQYLDNICLYYDGSCWVVNYYDYDNLPSYCSSTEGWYRNKDITKIQAVAHNYDANTHKCTNTYSQGKNATPGVCGASAKNIPDAN